MNLHGVMIAVACFLVIGVFHPIVIKAEYYFSSKCWPVFLAGGVLFLAASLRVRGVTASAILGVIGCSFLWSVLELQEQRKRVERGWFPKNPKRKNRRDTKTGDEALANGGK